MNLKTSLIASAVSMILIHNSLSYAGEITPVFTPELEARIGEIAADYMRAHPEILIQMSETLQQEKQNRGLILVALAQQARMYSFLGCCRQRRHGG